MKGRSRFRFLFGIIIAVAILGFQNCGSKFQVSDSLATSSLGSAASNSSATYAHASDQSMELKSFPAGLSNLNTAEFIFTAGNQFDLNNSALQCTVDDTPVACSTLWTETVPSGATARQVTARFLNLTDKRHMFRFKDAKTTYIDHVWTVDTVAPTIQISPAFAVNTTANDAAFSVTVSDQFTTSPRLECRYDILPFAPCTLPYRMNDLPDGAHAFSARATDDAGNVSPIAVYNFEVLSPSSTTVRILTKPLVASSETSAVFAFERGTAISSLKCSLNGGSKEICTDGMTYNNLVQGTYKITIEGFSSAGTLLATLDYSWEIQLPPNWLNFQARQIIANPDTSTYKLVIQAENATTYRWEVDGKAPLTTTVPEYTMIIDSTGDSRVLSYCAFAINKAAEVKVCGEVILSMYSIKQGKLYYGATAHWFQPTDISKIKILGLQFATDGANLYQGYVDRIAVSAVPTGLSVFHYSVGNDVYYWVNYQTPLFNGVTDFYDVRAQKVGSLQNWKLIETDGRRGQTSASWLSQINSTVYYQGFEVQNISPTTMQYKPNQGVRIKAISDSDTVAVALGLGFVEVAGADFTTLNYIGSNYYADKSNLYYVNSDKSVAVSTLPNQSTTIKDIYWLVSGGKIFYKGLLVQNAVPPIETTADPYMFASGMVYRADVSLNISSLGFKLAYYDVSTTGSVDLFANNTGVYLYDNKSKVKTQITGADGASFKSIYTNGVINNPLGVSTLDGFYFMDSDQIFSIKGSSPNYTITDIQASSIANPKLLSPGAALKTDSGIYIYNIKQTVTNPAGFASVNGTSFFFQDGTAVYVHEFKVQFINIGAATVLGYGHAKNCTTNKVYYGSKEIVGADCASFEASSVSSAWSRDINKCYVGGAFYSALPASCPTF